MNAQRSLFLMSGLTFGSGRRLADYPELLDAVIEEARAPLEAQLSTLREAHEEMRKALEDMLKGKPMTCAKCETSWPCDAAQLLTALAEANQQVAALKDALVGYVGDHDIHPAFMSDCPTCVALWPDRDDWLKLPEPGTPPAPPSGFTSGRHG